MKLKLTPEFFLRLGLGLTYAYSGYDILVHPTAWIWAIRALPIAIEPLVILQVQGVVELALAFLLLAWFVPKKFVKATALVVALEMFLIIFLVGLDAITFRDLGLLGAALALLVSLKSDHEH
jgi:hypothetical protein